MYPTGWLSSTTDNDGGLEEKQNRCVVWRSAESLIRAGSNIWRATQFTEWGDLIIVLTSLLRWWVRMEVVMGGQGRNVSRIKWRLLVKQQNAFSPLWELFASQNEFVISFSGSFPGQRRLKSARCRPDLTVFHAPSHTCKVFWLQVGDL